MYSSTLKTNKKETKDESLETFWSCHTKQYTGLFFQGKLFSLQFFPNVLLGYWVSHVLPNRSAFGGCLQSASRDCLVCHVRREMRVKLENTWVKSHLLAT